MKTKFKIVETEDYYLAVSDEEIKEDNWFLNTTTNTLHKVHSISKNIQSGLNGSEYHGKFECKRIVSHLPKNNARELLYDVKIPSDENVNMQKVSRLPLLPEIIKSKGFARLQYTEQDMIMAAKYGYEFRDTTSFPEHKFEDSCINNFKQKLQSLNQPKTPTHFEAETVTPYADGFTVDRVRRFYGKPELKTELINGKERLIGNYLFE